MMLFSGGKIMKISCHKLSWGVASTILAASLLSGCATDSRVPPTSAALTPVNLNDGVRSGTLVPKAESIMMVLDGSSSMGDPYNLPAFSSSSKFIAEKQIATLFANTMPDVKMDSGLLSFGFGECQGWSPTTVNLPMSPFSQTALSEAVASIPCASGGTPMHKAILATEDDVRNANGRVAMIVMGDGLCTDDDPVAYAKAMKEEFGDKLCIHTIWTGNDPAGKAVMSMIADASGCGIAVTGDQVADAGGMSGFIADALFDRGQPVLDSDGDGVPDASDKCPGTPRGVAVDADGCPPDSDGDGVPDYLDKCPNTPIGAMVNSHGCWSLSNVNFDFDSATIRADAYPELNNIVNILRKNPNMRVTLEGHTDSMGSERYNLGLSQRRARAVMNYLVRKGVSAGRLSSVGFGESRPIESNSTDSGRAANRRVDLNITSR
jgi:OOP family OmpA-OmpF porin